MDFAILKKDVRKEKRKMKEKKRWFPLFATLFVMGLSLTGTILCVNAKKDDTEKVVLDGVYFGDIDVSGCTEDEVKELVEDYISEYEDVEFTVTAGDLSVTATGKEIGLTWGNETDLEEAMNLGTNGNMIARYKALKDLENEDKVYDINVGVDEDTFTAFLEENSDSLHVEAVNNGLTREGNTFKITGGSNGTEVNTEDSLEAVNEYLASEWDGKDAELALVVEEVEPEGTEEELEKVQDLLGSFSTDYSSSASGRAKNVSNGASKINGTVIYPGETFSVYEAVSPFDEENGYALAGSYENGQTVETYGGGICQVSTTLYNAVLEAELEVVERHNHSMLVNYVEPSQDAAISGTSKDFKFENSTDAPIYIEGYTSGGIIYFNIYGEETRDTEERSVTYESETLSTNDPDTKFVTTSAAIGYYQVTTASEHVGKTAQLWKIVTVDGKEESREKVNSSSYQASPRTIEVGIGSDNKEAVAAIKSAISTGSESKVQAAISKWKGVVADESAAKAVTKAIKAIGTVTLKSESAIKSARSAYNALSADQKALVTNVDTLSAAEAKLKELKAAKNSETTTQTPATTQDTPSQDAETDSSDAAVAQ